MWLWEAAWERSWGTAQQYTLVLDQHAVALPGHAPFELGAALGVPALTAHRALTVHDGGPGRIAPGTLRGATVLVAGGAGAVGNAAIQLACWAGARVVTTVSSPAKAVLARAAGAHGMVNYRTQDAAAEILAFAPGGVDIVVEVAPGTNAALDIAVVRREPWWPTTRVARTSSCPSRCSPHCRRTDVQRYRCTDVTTRPTCSRPHDHPQDDVGGRVDRPLQRD
ncbi:zinc-binding dehydrogenase [Streptomyces sp. NPDC020607]|uniref:zinc-binding dehydrogenase n=1 Tax=Streptomyces sp. NPDC020607 TaxID=3365082 RepID=UPI003793ACC1